MNFIKNFFTAALLTTVVTGPAFAEKPGNCPHPRSKPPLNCCGRFNVSADFLFFKPCQGAFLTCSFGSSDTVISTDNETTTTTIFANDIEVPYRWDGGFRIGAGYEFGRGCIELSAAWTRFHTNAHGTSNLFWKLDFDVLDFALSRKISVNPCFYWEPFIGVRTVWIKQNLDVVYVNTTDNNGMISKTNVSENTAQKLTGTGPVFGTLADWSLGCGFGVYALGDLGIIYGRFKRTVDGLETTEDSEDTTRFGTDRARCASIVALDGGIGIRWKKCFCDCVLLTLKLGYEFHHYFDYNLINTTGDLSLNGGSVSATLEF